MEECQNCGLPISKITLCKDCFLENLKKKKSCVSEEAKIFEKLKLKHEEKVNSTLLKIEEKTFFRRKKRNLIKYLKQMVENLKIENGNLEQEIKKRSWKEAERRNTLDKANNALSKFFDYVDSEDKKLKEKFKNYEENSQLKELIQYRRNMLLHIFSYFPIIFKKGADRENRLHVFVVDRNADRNEDDYNYFLDKSDKDLGGKILLKSFGSLNGNIVFLLNTISKFLDFTLPYKMIYRGSKSVIIKDGIEFPLFSKFMETPNIWKSKTYSEKNEVRKNIHKAIQLLNMNIATLCNLNGISLAVSLKPNFRINLLALYKLKESMLGQLGPFEYYNKETAHCNKEGFIERDDTFSNHYYLENHHRKSINIEIESVTKSTSNSFVVHKKWPIGYQEEYLRENYLDILSKNEVDVEF